MRNTYFLIWNFVILSPYLIILTILIRLPWRIFSATKPAISKCNKASLTQNLMIYIYISSGSRARVATQNAGQRNNKKNKIFCDMKVIVAIHIASDHTVVCKCVYWILKCKYIKLSLMHNACVVCINKTFFLKIFNK